MGTIKRIKVQEHINEWNDKNPIKIKKTAGTIGIEIGIDGRNLSLWNHGNVPKQIQALYDISVALDCDFDSLFIVEYQPYKDEVTMSLKRIAIQESIDEWNKTRRKMSINRISKIINYSVLRLKGWNEGDIPFPITNFFNFCKNLEIKKPFKTLEF